MKGVDIMWEVFECSFCSLYLKAKFYKKEKGKMQLVVAKLSSSVGETKTIDVQ